MVLNLMIYVLYANKRHKNTPILTIHKTKGLEFNSIYFIDLEDSASWNFDNQPEEERCAFACEIRNMGYILPIIDRIM